MNPFPSTEKFRDLVLTAEDSARQIGLLVDRYLVALMSEGLKMNARQASIAGLAMSSLHKEVVATDGDFDPLEPAEAIMGRWTREDGTSFSRPVVRDTWEFRTDLNYTAFDESGNKSLGVYVAGLSDHGYRVALCSVDGDADEMHVDVDNGTATLGEQSLRRIDPVSTTYRTLIEAAYHGDVADIGRHIRNGENPNQHFTNESAGGQAGETTPMLSFLAFKAPQPAIEALLEAGANPDITNAREETPLHFAVKFDRPALVGCLAAHGADVDARASNGRTALHMAVIDRNADMVRTLVQHGANPDLRTPEGKSARDLARAVGLSHLI